MPTEPRLTNLPVDPTTGLFRLVDNQLRKDPAVQAAVKTFLSWQGKPEDTADPSVEQAPWLRLTPRYGPEEWWAASTLTGWLYIGAELFVAGTCYDDLSNLWGALQRACYPADAAQRLAFQARLRAAGAHTGLVKFNRPVVANNPYDDGAILGAGWLALEYRFDTNPTSPGL